MLLSTLNVPRRGLRERNKQDKLRRIEHAARTLFSERGFEATTTREVARSAGIGVGTLFLYFPEKRDLLFHIFRQDIEEVQARAFENIPASGHLIDELMHVFSVFYDHYSRDRRLARVYLEILAFLGESQRAEMLSITLGYFERLAVLIRAAQSRGEIAADVDPLDAAYVCWSLYYVGMIALLSGLIQSRPAHEKRVRSSLDLAMRGLGGHETN